MNIGNQFKIKREILVRIVKAFFEDDFSKKARLIPYDMRPKGAEVPFRCCIHKERAILKNRVIAGLGFSIENDDETVSLSEYAQRAVERTELEADPLTVVGTACKACVPKRVYVTDLCQGCVARPCQSTCKFGAINIVNGRSVIDNSKCKACQMCVQVCPYKAIVKVAVPCEDNCPVGAIQKNDDGTAHIDFSKCISCGKCVASCPFGAIHEKSHIIDVLRLIKNREEVSVMFAPAIASQFPGTLGQFKSALKKLNFSHVYEVAVGADITTRNEAVELEERLGEGQAFMTTSCCAGYNELIKKHAPEIKPFESTTKTPMYYTAELAKKEHPNAKSVFVSPCVAKKREALDNENVDYILSAEELGAMFIGLGVEIMNCDEYVDERKEPSKQGRKFSVTGGVAEAVKHLARCEVKPLVMNGLNKTNIALLKAYAKSGKCPAGNIIEVMCCEGGCVGGCSNINDAKASVKQLQAILDKSSDLER